MKVILLQDITGTGKKGDMKEVSDGYARHLLLPKQMARSATRGAIGEAEASLEKKKRIREKEANEAQSHASKIHGKTVMIQSKANAEGTLYAAVGPNMIAEAIAVQFGIRVEEKNIRRESLIKKPGEYPATVVFLHGIHASITMSVSYLQDIQ